MHTVVESATRSPFQRSFRSAWSLIIANLVQSTRWSLTSLIIWCKRSGIVAAWISESRLLSNTAPWNTKKASQVTLQERKVDLERTYGTSSDTTETPRSWIAYDSMQTVIFGRWFNLKWIWPTRTRISPELVIRCRTYNAWTKLHCCSWNLLHIVRLRPKNFEIKESSISIAAKET